jgi:hypothetical protein
MMKYAPKTPQIAPTAMQDGSTLIVGEITETYPNLRLEALMSNVRIPPSLISTGKPHIKPQKARENTASAQLIKTFQIVANLQNVFGLLISYAKSVPPIGAPKAALTPAEVPAAINSLLLRSFLK